MQRFLQITNIAAVLSHQLRETEDLLAEEHCPQLRAEARIGFDLPDDSKSIHSQYRTMSCPSSNEH